jgi:anti-sigma factor RsiW
VNDLDFERLSAYLDDALSDDERAAIEMRLAREPALRETLSELRTLKTWIGALPELKAPRDFTLTPGMLAQELSIMKRSVPYHRAAMMAAPQPKQRSNLIVALAGLASSAAAIGLIVAGLVLASSPAAPPAEIVLVSTETPTVRPAETKITVTALPQIQAAESEELFELFSAAPAVEPAAAPPFPLPTSPAADRPDQILEPMLEDMPSQMELVPQAARELAPELPAPGLAGEAESEVEAAEAMLDDVSPLAGAVQPQLAQPASGVVLPTATVATAPAIPTATPSPAAEPVSSASTIEQRAFGGLMFGAGAALLLVTATLWLRWHRRVRHR